MPLALLAAILSRMRSPVTSRSNCANDGMLSVNRPHRCGGVELLRDRDKGDAVAVENLDQLCEVRQAAREAVDFVDDHGIDLPASMSIIRRRNPGRSMLPPE